MEKLKQQTEPESSLESATGGQKFQCSRHGEVAAGHRCKHFNRDAVPQEQRIPDWQHIKIGELWNWKGMVGVLDVIEIEQARLTFQLVGLTGKAAKRTKQSQGEIIAELRRRIVPGDTERFIELIASFVTQMQIQAQLLVNLGARQDNYSNIVEAHNAIIVQQAERIEHLAGRLDADLQKETVQIIQHISTDDQSGLSREDMLAVLGDLARLVGEQALRAICEKRDMPFEYVAASATADADGDAGAGE